jgi:hypothetical protein
MGLACLWLPWFAWLGFVVARLGLVGYLAQPWRVLVFVLGLVFVFVSVFAFALILVLCLSLSLSWTSLGAVESAFGTPWGRPGIPIGPLGMLRGWLGAPLKRLAHLGHLIDALGTPLERLGTPWRPGPKVTPKRDDPTTPKSSNYCKVCQKWEVRFFRKLH